jgi:hypothetical protein
MRFSTDRLLLRLWPLWLALFASCRGDILEPNPDPPGTTKPPADLRIIKLPANHPPFFNDSVAFYAKVGDKAEGTIYFQDSHGDRGDKFAELKIDDQSLRARPDGTPFERGDSILIVMKVADQSEFLVEMRPSGLKFSAGKPAQLKLEYGSTDGDLDGNGHKDHEDDKIEKRLGIWVQETPSDPFVKIGTVKTQNARELKASLQSFSRFAIAY